ncbi:MAG: polyhydroxyalkanoate depolymerase [Pseudomonadota bacterium]
MYYQLYEWNHAFLSPARAFNDAIRLYYKNPLNPLSHTEFGRQIAAGGDLFERVTRRYGKPEFGIETTVIDGYEVPVCETVVWERPFCRLLHFKRARPEGAPAQPKVVLFAPMSGHYATLLRGTVAAFLPNHEVYITDWVDARMAPLHEGRFDLDTYIDYVLDIVHAFAGDLHLVAVCQPAVPVFAATALLEARQSASLPKSITLMGGPIDTRENPTEVNVFATKHDLDWFRRNVIMTVPFPHPGVLRRVYPGFLQLSGFMTMNLDRHLSAHYDYFDHLMTGDGDSAEKHRDFYDEYLSVMDLTEEFYMQTIDTVFLRQALPHGTMTHRGVPVDPKAIKRTPILTIEGENDDISGLGQTRAAHKLTPNLPKAKHQHYEQPDVGHYGVFNGSRFRREIAPRIGEFVAEWDQAKPDEASPTPKPRTSRPSTATKAKTAGAAKQDAGAQKATPKRAASPRKRRKPPTKPSSANGASAS